jgi:hypothetical protein
MCNTCDFDSCDAQQCKVLGFADLLRVQSLFAQQIFQCQGASAFGTLSGSHQSNLQTSTVNSTSMERKESQLMSTNWFGKALRHIMTLKC